MYRIYSKEGGETIYYGYVVASDYVEAVEKAVKRWPVLDERDFEIKKIIVHNYMDFSESERREIDRYVGCYYPYLGSEKGGERL